MLQRFLLVLLALGLVWPVQAADDDYPRNPNVDILHYDFHLTLSDETDEVIGETGLSVFFRAAGETQFALDLVGKAGEKGMTVTAVMEGNQAIRFTHAEDRVTLYLASPSKEKERRTFTVQYRGIPGDGLIIDTNKFGDRTFFGDNWPNRARHWLPTVDHPHDKATCAFIVTAPDHYQVVGSGRLVEETDLMDGTRRTHWQTRVPMATKVMVIGVARFAVHYVDEFEGISIESWVYPQEREQGFFDYAIAERILAFFEGHIGDFPYEKLANVQSKTRYGGMENASNIFYHENSINGRRGSEGLFAHEIAHQWFGDSVTEADWHHIWLSEGFATYFTQLYLEHQYGRDRLVQGMNSAKTSILNYFKNNPTAPIVDTSITDLNRLLSANSYQKGGWVLHMLRGVVGTEVFWDGIRAYYAQYRDGNALTEDFQRVMEDAAGEDLNWFFQQWIYQPGQPKIEGDWQYDAEGKTLTVQLKQVQTNGTFFRVPMQIGIVATPGSTPRIETLEMMQATQTFTLPLDAAPADVHLDPQTWVLMETTWQRRN